MKNQSYADLSDLSVQKDLIKRLAPLGVSRNVFRALFGMTNNKMSSRAGAVQIHFSKFTPADAGVMRELLVKENIDPVKVAEALRAPEAVRKPRSTTSRGHTPQAVRTNVQPATVEAAVRIASVSIAAIEWPTDDEVRRESARQMTAAAKAL
jgi:hypothetical protein